MITANNSNSLNLYLLKIKNKDDVFELEGIYSSEERMIAALNKFRSSKRKCSFLWTMFTKVKVRRK